MTGARPKDVSPTSSVCELQPGGCDPIPEDRPDRRLAVGEFLMQMIRR